MLLADPSENVEAILARHFQVEQQESRQGIIDRIGESAFSFQVGDCFLTIADDLKAIENIGPREGRAYEQDVVVRVLGEQNDRFVSHRWCGDTYQPAPKGRAFLWGVHP